MDRMPLRVGIDLVDVDAVGESLDTHGEQYLARVYTDRELDACRSATGIAVERLAARFAAKEAAMKVLRPSSQDAIPWPSIEVLSAAGGWVSLELGGAAAELAEQAGIEELQLSITHEGTQACAVVIAELRDGCR
jgi:holo-[acyl-carrier protein] synthase